MVQKPEKLQKPETHGKSHRMAILNSAVVVAVVTGAVALIQTVIRTERGPEEPVENWSDLQTHSLFFILGERRIIRDAHQCQSGDSLSTRLAKAIGNVADETVADMLDEVINEMEARPITGELWRIHVLRSLERRIGEYNQQVREIPALPPEVLRWFMKSREQATRRRSRAIEDITVAGRSSYELTEIWLNWFVRLYRERITHQSAWWCINVDSAMVGGRPTL